MSQSAENPANKKSILSFLHFENPTKEQENVLAALEQFVSGDDEDDFMVVCGSAGTGKSSIMNAVVKYASQEKLRVEIAAPTGRAARLISAKTNTDGNTLHSMLFKIKTKASEAAILFEEKGDKIEDLTVFIIDEASMINSAIVRNQETELFKCEVPILNAIKSYTKSGNTKNKIIFVGDRFQLPPVGENDSNALYPNYLRKNFSWKGTEFELTEVKRTAEDSIILNTASTIRENIKDNKEIQPIKGHSSFNYLNVIPAYLKDLKEFGPNNVTAISSSHKQNKSFNYWVRKKRFSNLNALVMKYEVLTIKRNWKCGGLTLHNGDTVMVKEIDYNSIQKISGLSFVPVTLRAKDKEGKEIEISDYLLLDCVTAGAGSLGAITENKLYADRHRCNKTYRESGDIRDDAYLSAIRAIYGYSITCNTAQGGEWEKVYLNRGYIPNARWAYTAVTRAKENLYLFS